MILGNYRSDAENPTGIETDMEELGLVKKEAIAAMLKTRQGLKRLSEVLKEVPKLNRSDAENPTGIETTPEHFYILFGINRSDAENPTGIETIQTSSMMETICGIAAMLKTRQGLKHAAPQTTAHPAFRSQRC